MSIVDVSPETLAPRGAPAPQLDDEELAYLRALAYGCTEAEMAEAADFSRLEMHRLLRRIYDRLGAADRFGALSSATRFGLI